MQDFIKFIREQGIVGLAIGFILGGAVSDVVSSFVFNIVQPIVGFLFGSTKGLTDITLGPINLGYFFTSVIDFVIIAAVVYFIFKKLNFEKLDSKKEK